ncbi:MAG TPA: hypothetical protein VL069_02200 [Opitutus sp.]|nr:hypothetical protein [Opitutus sp.]
MYTPHSSSAPFGASIVTSVLDILKRLTAALHLLRLAEQVIPTLLSRGHVTGEEAQKILDQIPALRSDIDEQVNAAKFMMASIQDRVESIAQFLLFHRDALGRAQVEDLDRWLAEVRG